MRPLSSPDLPTTRAAVSHCERRTLGKPDPYGAELLEQLLTALNRYVELSSAHASIAVTLWMQQRALSGRGSPRHGRDGRQWQCERRGYGLLQFG